MTTAGMISRAVVEGMRVLELHTRCSVCRIVGFTKIRRNSVLLVPMLSHVSVENRVAVDVQPRWRDWAVRGVIAISLKDGENI